MRNYGGLLRVAVLIWLVVCIYCLCRAEQSEVYEPMEMPIEEAEAVLVVEIPEEEPEDPMTKLPSIENATLTHYCICKRCCGKDEDHPAYGITASGRQAEPYKSVAVDPFLIPLGSKVYIDYGDGEIKEYRADDTGSGVAGAHIDLCVTEHDEALELGVKTVRVWWEEY